ncbi:GUN4 domain-containing protein [Actinocorallia aurantiaca]|uniref:GUN4-like domain-containing protein n=1 Tax=Actinocorallia aurantiaca TaxID=46204 RepID=A0ABN3TVW2_9ACTN
MSLVTRFVMGVDVEKFSSRNANQHLVIQRELDRMLTEAALAAGLDRAGWECRAEGDGEVAVLPADIDLTFIVRRFVVELDSLLADHNEHHQANTQIRLRVAMHLDSLTWGRLGYAGEGLTVLNRLLDSRPIRDTLQGAAEANLVQIISEDVFNRAVRPEIKGIKERQFTRVLVDLPAKGFRQNAYLYVPGVAAAPPARNVPEAEAPNIFDQFRGLAHPPRRPRQDQRPSAPEPTAPKRNVTRELPVLSPRTYEQLAALRVALRDGELMRADALTTRILLEAGGQARHRLLRTSDAANLPDTLFAEVDALWAEYSGGRWGFAAQREHLADGPVSNRRDFHRLSLALGWRTNDGVAPPYKDFVAAGNTGLPFYPTLRLPDEEEKNPNWYDEWVTTAVSLHARLHGWT